MGVDQAQFSLPPIMSAKRKRLAARSGDGRHHVYFLQLVSGGAIKIGYTKNIAFRLPSIAADMSISPNSLVVRGYVSLPYGEGRKLERALHVRFADRKVDGEWFQIDGMNLLHEVIEVARMTVDGEWTVSGLAHDETPDVRRRTYNITRTEANKLKRRARHFD